jgi:hypothetical protein
MFMLMLVAESSYRTLSQVNGNDASWEPVSGVDGVAQAQQADTGANKREFHLYCHPF